MATLDWSQCPAVESIPGKVSGAWTFRNSRTPVRVVFENLEDGMTIDEVIEQYPVSREEIKAVLEFAAQSLDKEPSYQAVLILLDNNAPRGLVSALSGHAVTEARERGWATLVRRQLAEIASAISTCTPGSYSEVEIPLD